MISKNKLKELAAYRMQKRCDDEDVFIVEGVKMAAEAMAAGADIRCVCATADWIDSQAGEPSYECHEVSAAELERLSLMRTPNHVWMLVGRRPIKVVDQPLVLALDHIQDPGNMGTILRIADWFGIRQVVCSADTASVYNPKVVQASMGAVFRTHVDYTDLPKWLVQSSREIYGASLQGTDIRQATPGDNNQPAALLIGNESRGISPECMTHVTRPVLIPNIGGTAESLNAAVATAILTGWLTGVTGNKQN